MAKSRSRHRIQAGPRAAHSVTPDDGSGLSGGAIDSLTNELNNLDDAFFDNLAVVGGHPLSDEARGMMRGYVTGYLAMVEGYYKLKKPKGEKGKLMPRMAESSRWLACAIEAAIEVGSNEAENLSSAMAANKDDPCFQALCGALIPFNQFRAAPQMLREIAAEAAMLGDTRPRPVGNRSRGEDDQLIRFLAELYHRIGGRVAVSQDGPFGRFLKAAREGLPRHVRNASSETFVRRAAYMTAELKRHVRGLPRNLTAGRASRS